MSTMNPFSFRTTKHSGAVLFLAALLLVPIALPLGNALPVPPQFFAQRVDHFDNQKSESRGTFPTVSLNTTATASITATSKTYAQRYYVFDKYFQGPGSPIFLILGGEGGIEPSRGILYDVVAMEWARTLGAAVLQPEHRFYGTSQPVSPQDIQRARDAGLPDPRERLLTTEQALYDAVRLTQYYQTKMGCATTEMTSSSDATTSLYCPVIAVGGSYPGFLAATIRLRFPHVIDMAYAA